MYMHICQKFKIRTIYRTQKDMDKTKINADAEAVSNIMELVNNAINPFDNEFNYLVHLTSGSVASNIVESDMKNMYQKGMYPLLILKH